MGIWWGVKNNTFAKMNYLPISTLADFNEFQCKKYLCKRMEQKYFFTKNIYVSHESRSSLSCTVFKNPVDYTLHVTFFFLSLQTFGHKSN